MTQQPRRDEEELVEEMVWLLQECIEATKAVPDYEFFAVLHDYAEKVATLISQAIAEGKVKLAEEVGRRVWNVDMMVMPDGEMWGVPRGSTIIALSPAERKEGTGPLTGTGKEEEE